MQRGEGETPFDLPVRTFSRCKWHEIVLKGFYLYLLDTFQPRTILRFLFSFFFFFFLLPLPALLLRLKRNVDASRSIHRGGHEKLGHVSAFPRTFSLPFFPSSLFPVHSFFAIAFFLRLERFARTSIADETSSKWKWIIDFFGRDRVSKGWERRTKNVCNWAT